MQGQPTDMTLLEQHIFKQNQRIIELSNNLKKFCDAGQYAIDNAEEKAGERKSFVQWAIAGVAACAVIFGGTGYLVRMGFDALSLNSSRERVSEANTRAEAAEKFAASAVEVANAQAAIYIEKIRKDSGWPGTEQGRLAKKFFDEGSGAVAALCSGESWTIAADNKGAKWCIPQRRGFFDFGEDSAKKYGWKIP